MPMDTCENDSSRVVFVRPKSSQSAIQAVPRLKKGQGVETFTSINVDILTAWRLLTASADIPSPAHRMLAQG